jgi:hypothetical protein
MSFSFNKKENAINKQTKKKLGKWKNGDVMAQSKIIPMCYYNIYCELIKILLFHSNFRCLNEKCFPYSIFATPYWNFFPISNFSVS